MCQPELHPVLILLAAMQHFTIQLSWWVILATLCWPGWALQGFRGTHEGICNQYIQVTKTRTRYQNVFRTYQYSKKCGFLYRKRCWKTDGRWVTEEIPEQYTENVLTAVCCIGFEMKNYECSPTCNPECENGYCSAVDQCSCYQGYKQNSSTICVPICSTECQNGVCTAPETCSCAAGYRKDDLDSYVCSPFCSQECQHGICMYPETCFCDPGYKLDPINKYVCIPICTGGCQNGNCVGPDTCSCWAGYEKDSLNRSICLPVCLENCVNAKCTAPNQCTCSDGYIKTEDQSNVCEPYCSKPCKNGFCSAPEQCSCHSGFKENIKNPYECDPVCSRECVNSVCSRPETCFCFEGYQIDSFDKYVCEPVCSKECKNSMCRAPEICICNQGYIYDQEDSYSCIPYCSEGCVNSNCTAPDVCECYDGYEKINNQKHVCEPVCSECKNAYCVGPETCECWDGYEMYTKNHCVPICSSCQYGNCDYPEFCGCWAGYDNPADSNATCVPVCDEGCVNSLCTAPDICTCLDGFVNITGDWNTCSPHCSEECLNGICMSPEECECLPGFEVDEIRPYSCLPFCSSGCANGQCIAPEYCDCFWGFQPSENGSVCSEPSNPMTDCFFNRKFSFETYSEEQCSNLSINNKQEPMAIIGCPFLETMLMKHFSYMKMLSIELNCSLNSTFNDGELSIICITDQIIINDSEYSSDFIVSERPQLENDCTNSSTVDCIGSSSFQNSPSTVRTSQEPDIEISEPPKTSEAPYQYSHYDFGTKPFHGNKHLFDKDTDVELQTENLDSGNPSTLSSIIQISTLEVAVSISSTENDEALSTKIQSTTTNGDYEEDLYPQIQSNTSHSEQEANNSKNITIKMKLDNVPYIRKYGILKEHFNDVTGAQVPLDLCLCSDQLSRSSCEGDFQLKLYTCPCHNKLEAGFFDKSEKRLSVLSAFVTILPFLLVATILGIGSFLYHSKKPKRPEDKLIVELEKELKKLQVLTKSERNKNIDVDTPGDENETDL